MTVRFEQVSFHYPGAEQAGVEAIDLEIGAGELLVIIGASGSGKSTLLKLLAGFLMPERGRVLIDGEDVTHLPPERRRLGIVFQSYALFPHMSVADNVAYPLKVRGLARDERRRRAEAALARVGLEGFADRPPASLSGGQQQRVALARALVYEPRALLLDEPLSALDAGLRQAMRDEIVRVQREVGVPALHVTHDQEEALSMADRVAVMAEGRLLQIATPRELYDNPVSREVAAFVGHANLWPARVVARDLISTPLGRLACATEALPVGAAVTAMVRPEAVRPLHNGEAAPNRVAGRVLRDRFLGPLRRVDLEADTPDGAATVTCETRYRDGIAAVAIPPEAIRLLPGDSAPASPPSDKERRLQ